MYLLVTALPEKNEGALYDPLLKKWDIFSVSREESCIDVVASRTHLSAIQGIQVVHGPGPFLSLRNIALMANTIQTFSSSPLSLSSLPTEVFLAHMFPGAEILLMSAGKRNVLIAKKGEVGMEKKPLSHVLPLLSEFLWGGILFPDTKNSIPEEGKQREVFPLSPEEYWKACFCDFSLYATEQISPRYAKNDEWG